MSDRLVIVESPNKVKKVQSLLGPGWRVAASSGHVRDLPVHDLGVDLDTLRPTYAIIDDRSKRTVANLRSKAKQASEVWIATDPDREGEAIGWHCARLLKLKDPKRVSFQEITAQAVQEAVQSPRKIDMDLVRAQETRRILDRLVGYLVSPAMGRKVGRRGLSAGRVQTVTLRLVVERELEITKFKSTTHYGVRAFFSTTNSADGAEQSWSADWDTSPHLKADEKYIQDKTLAERVAQLREFNVVDVEKKQAQRRPAPPFTTSSLQQAASASLKISSKNTMAAAQKLFETGLITYHRTDSVALSDEAVNASKAWLNNNGLSDYIATTPHKWKQKAAAQEAHEATRPTDMTLERAQTGDRNADALYRLIWLRTVCSQMKAAVYDVTTIALQSQQQITQHGPERFVAKGRVMRFPGWMAIMKGDPAEEQSDKDDSASDTSGQALPTLASGDALQSESSKVLEKKTKPPARYTEGTLIKKMESLNIGRPATYSSIISVIQKRKYVVEKKRKLHATDLGIGVIRLLVGRFQFAEPGFTSQIETRLDSIARGNDTYNDVTRMLLDALQKEIDAFAGADIKVGHAFDSAPQRGPQVEFPKVKTPCPECEPDFDPNESGSSTEPNTGLGRIHGKYGVFWGCSNRECSVRLRDADGEPDFQHYRAKKRAEANAEACPSCKNGKLLWRDGKKGSFYGCSNYPKCAVTMRDTGNGPDTQGWIAEQEARAKRPLCPVCEKGRLKPRSGSNGVFWGCDAFPSCRATFPGDDQTPEIDAGRVEWLKTNGGKTKGGKTRRKTAQRTKAKV